MAEKSVISIWTTEITAEQKKALPTLARKTTTVVQVGTDVISKNINTFIQEFRQIADKQDEASGFYIDEIELSLSVNAKGGIELLGKVEGGAQASIKVKLKRKS